MIIFAHDPHGAYRHLIQACEKYNPTAMILLGDNELPGSIPDLFSSVIESGIKVYAILGNHDTGYLRKADIPHMIDRKVIEVDGLRVSGSDYESGASGLIDYQEVDIMVSHYPPDIQRDEIEWRRTAQQAIKSNAVALFHGHLHSRFGEQTWIDEFAGCLSVNGCDHLVDEYGNILGRKKYGDDGIEYLADPDDDFSHTVEHKMKSQWQHSRGDWVYLPVYDQGCGECVYCHSGKSCARETKVNHDFKVDVSNGKINGTAAFHFLAAQQRARKSMLKELLNIRRAHPRKIKCRGIGGLIRYPGCSEWTIIDANHQATDVTIQIKRFGEKTASKFFGSVRFKSGSATTLILNEEMRVAFLDFLSRQSINL